MITSELFGTTKCGTEITKFILKNNNDFEIHLLSYGLTIQKILYPTTNPKSQQDVVLGFDSLQEYEEHSLFIGCIVGRNANRLSEGAIFIDNQKIQLSQNEGVNQLHGGQLGFDKKVWNCEVINNKVKATYISPDGEEGFPGKVTTTLYFELTEANELKIDLEATTNKTTVVNLTRHDYFNLKDGGATTINSHQIQINATAYTPVDNQSLVTGELLPTNQHPAFDLKTPVTINSKLSKHKDELPKGYDHNFSVNQAEKLNTVAIATEPESGRQVEILSTQPGVQFYTGGHITDIQGKENNLYKSFHGFCLETQHFPDATKHPHFSSTIVTPEKPYSQQIIYKLKA